MSLRSQHRFLCEKTRNECVFCAKSKKWDLSPTKRSNALNADSVYAVPQSVRMLAYVRAQLALKMTAVICGDCLSKNDNEIIACCLNRSTVRARALRPGECLPMRWRKRCDGAIRALMHRSKQTDALKAENEDLKQNQRTHWDVTQKYRRVNVDLHSQRTRDAYSKRKRESEQKWSAEKTNRHNNFVSYWKLSNMDCFSLCHNTRGQIAEMAEHAHLSEEMVFYWWHRFYTKSSFVEQSILFGLSSSALKKLWHATTPKLFCWAKQYLINDGPESEQYWTRERIQANTTQMARSLHDPLDEGRVIVVMDGTYIYTQCVQSDHEIRQHLWSQHKSGTLVKPHLTVCTNGKIIHGGDVFWANICGSDTHIYHSMTDVTSLRRFLENPEADDSPFTPTQIKELLYFNKIWGCKGIAITDNGYHINDARIRKPKDVKKGQRGTTLSSHWKRHVTMPRQVTERVNSSIKKWKLIGEGKVWAAEIPFISQYATIAMGHHNAYSCVYQRDHVDNMIQTKRLLEMRNVVENPCASFWIPRPPNRKKKKGAAASQPLPPRAPYDDGFNTVAQTRDAVRQWLHQCRWLKGLKLKAEDGQDLVGRQFQHRLCHRYIRFLETNFRLKVHKTNRCVLKFENLKSKYKSSTKRHVLLNFTHVVQCRRNRMMQEIQRVQNPAQSAQRAVTESEESTVTNLAVINPARAMEEKKWDDIDFSLWTTDLARMQYYCTCNAGAQMVNPCAHVSAALYLVIWTMEDCLEEKLKSSKRDVQIKESVTNLRPLMNFWKQQQTQHERAKVQLHCRCNQPFHGYMPQCPGCEEHYHPECIGTTKEEIESKGLSNFKCPACDPFSMLFRKKELATEQATAVVPELQDMELDV